MAGTRHNKKLPASSEMINARGILSLPAAEVLDRLHISASGLAVEEAASRLETYGSNEVAREKQALGPYRISVPL